MPFYQTPLLAITAILSACVFYLRKWYLTYQYLDNTTLDIFAIFLALIAFNSFVYMIFLHYSVIVNLKQSVKKYWGEDTNVKDNS